MKKFAKISAMLAAMVLAFAFSGCSDGSSGGGSDDSSEINGGGTSGGETSGGETSGGETSGGETSGGETSGGETSGGETSGGETSGGETSGGETSGGRENIPEVFLEVPAASITGSETWTPSSSSVFVSGRTLNIEAFYMSDHEVTQAEWKAVMDGNLPEKMANTDGTADNNPVNYVSWYDAIVYCNKRSIKEGLTPCYTISDSTNPDDWGDVPTTSSNSTWNKAKCNFEANGYRLPTEAEWEWAARGRNDNTTYAGSNHINYVAWYAGNTNNTGTREVKTKKPNGYGLYDMSGNVWEWCWDWSENISSSTPELGASSGYRRVKRGGSWHGDDSRCEVAYRDNDGPNCRLNNLGFRVVRSAQ